MTRTALLLLTLLAGVSYAQEPPQPETREALETRIGELRATEVELESQLAASQAQLADVQAEIQRLEGEVILLMRQSPGAVNVMLDSDWVLFKQPNFADHFKPNIEGAVTITGCEADNWWEVTAGQKKGWLHKAVRFQELDAHADQVLQALRARCVKEAEAEKQAWLEERAAEARQAELEREEAIRQAEAARRARGSEPFLITRLRVEGPDSAGGVGAVVRLMMLVDERTLKYLSLTYTPYNGVGDRVASENPGRISSTTRKITGPMSFQDGEGSWGGDPIWYNPSIRCVEIDRIAVEYLNGERHTYVRELPKVLDPSIRNDCSYHGR